MEHVSDLEVLERLKQAAKADSDKSLATLLGLSRQSVAKARATKSVPSSWIPIAAKLFNVSTDWLFFGSDSIRLEEPPRPAKATQQQPERPLEAAGCARCAKLEAKIDALETERREMGMELREVNAENRRMAKENRELSVDNGVLREQIRKLSGKSLAVDCA